MKTIEIDDDLYTFIAAQTKHIGESASDILRRLLMGEAESVETPVAAPVEAKVTEPAPVKAPAKAPAKAPESAPVVEAAVALPDTDGKALLDVVTPDAIGQYTKKVEQFLFVLGVLANLHQQDFARVEDIRGKNRIYFAPSKEALLTAGSSTNPKNIPQSDYWVVTNNNSAKKQTMLDQVMQTLGYADDVRQSVLDRFAHSAG